VRETQRAFLGEDLEHQQERSESRNAVSNRLVDLIDILFGVVVAVNFAVLLGNSPFNSVPAIEQIITLPNLSILVAYVAIILSWLGYHQMIENNPYVLLNPWGYARFSIDVVIVFMYTVLMYSINITPLYLGSFAIVFLFYAIGGMVRNKEYDMEVSWPRGSLKYAALFVAVTAIWLLWELVAVQYFRIDIIPKVLISAILVFVALALNLLYRYERAKKGFKRKN